MFRFPGKPGCRRPRPPTRAGTDSPGVSAGLEFAAPADAGNASRGGADSGSSPRSALCLQHGDAASGRGKIEAESTPLRAATLKIDWAVSLENGYVPQNQFPAKYRFDVVAENCNSDYVVFGLTVTSGTQANLVGINNLYTGATPACNSGSPWVAFAYNTVRRPADRLRRRPRFRSTGPKSRLWKAPARARTSMFWYCRIQFRRRHRSLGRC